MSSTNTYLPYLMRIDSAIDEAPGVRTFRLKFINEVDEANFTFKAGQFGEYSVFGEGESTFCIASSPTRSGYIECTFRQVGRVTAALARQEAGSIIGFRGPYGNIFPLDDWNGRNILFVAGGIALPPLRSVIWNVLDQRARFRDVTVLYGARSVADLVYKQELEEWGNRADMKLVTTVDPGGETPEWREQIGFVPTILEQLAPSAQNTMALVCGPPVMIKYSFPVLEKLGFTPDQIYTTLENRMKCGVGKCGRCTVGPVYVCKDGPVFSYRQLRELPQEY